MRQSGSHEVKHHRHHTTKLYAAWKEVKEALLFYSNFFLIYYFPHQKMNPSSRTDIASLNNIQAIGDPHPFFKASIGKGLARCEKEGGGWFVQFWPALFAFEAPYQPTIKEACQSHIVCT